MLTVNKLISQGRGMAAVLVKRAATVELDWDVRQKSRFDATDSQGRALGVFLPRGTAVRGGDLLVAEDGSLVRVVAARQPVLVVTACPEHGSAFDLLRAAYHLGNRHVQLELRPDRLALEPDHVLADMLRQMHLIVTESSEAFEPEAGAYTAGGHRHSHGAAGDVPSTSQLGQMGHGHFHDHGRDDAHDHAHDHAHHASHGHDHGHSGHGHGHDAAHGHAPAPTAARSAIAIAAHAAPAPHVHGPGCKHGHEHDHKH